jgi:hypothetical protein
MRTLATLATLATLSLPTVALAEPAIATDAPRAERRVDTRLGLLIGRGDVGDVTGPSTGLHASLGYRVGDVTVMAEYDYLTVGDSLGEAASRDGRLSRAGGAVRYQLADVAPRGAPLGLEFWVEGGGGVERVSWQRGGLLYRPDAMLGFGFEVDGKGWRTPRPRHFGLFVAMRAHVARSPRTDEPAMCEGPCTIATPPSRNDVSLFFHMGLHWGR